MQLVAVLVLILPALQYQCWKDLARPETLGFTATSLYSVQKKSVKQCLRRGGILICLILFHVKL